MYGKMNDDGSVEIFTKKYVILDGVVFTNPDDSTLRTAGYKPIVYTGNVIVTSDSNLVVKYIERENYIQMWHETEDGYIGEEIE